MLDRSRSRDRSKTGGAFSPAGLFVTGAQGAWYDPSDFSTLFQDAAGSTPVTAVEQPVRLMLDRSRGLVLGPELVTNGDFATDSDWTKGTDWTIAAGVASKTAGTAAFLSQAMSLVAGRAYAVTFTATVSAGTIQPQFSTTTSVLGTARSVSGTYTEILVAVTGNDTFRFLANSTFAGTIDNISVRELPGAHALAPNDASRPVLRARYNLLTRSEEFDNAAWTKVEATITANAAVAPDGTTTADKFIPSTSAAAHYMTVSAASAAEERIGSVYVQLDGSAVNKVTLYPGGAATFAHFNLSNLTTTKEANVTSNAIEVLQNGWYRLTAVWPASVTSFLLRVYASSGSLGASPTAGDGTSGILIWGAQFLTSADQAATGNAYQRIAAATDYDVSNPVFRPYLAFDGTDDSLSTSSIDFSGTDEMTVFAGVTKLSDAALGVVAELTVSSSTQDGAFTLLAPDSPTGYAWASKGTTRVFPGVGGFNAPNTAVLTGIGDIGGDVATLRANGVQAVTNTDDQGTGNYANAALFIGRRGGSSLSYNGRLYSLAVIGRTATAPEVDAMETYVAGKTGVNLP